MTETPTSTNKPTIRHAGGTRYDVQSRTRPERTHHTDVYHLTCDCEAGQHGKRCWALALAVSFDAWRRQEGKKARVQAGSQWVAPQQAPAAGHEAPEAQSSSAAVPAPVTPPVAPAGDWHASAAYQALAQAFE